MIIMAHLLLYVASSRGAPGIGRSGPEDVEELLAGDQEPTERSHV
jgi:hypothetical protein